MTTHTRDRHTNGDEAPSTTEKNGLSDGDIRDVFHTLHLDTEEERARLNRFPEWPPRPEPGWEIKWGADSRIDENLIKS